jgi:hypothetical protein
MKTDSHPLGPPSDQEMVEAMGLSDLAEEYEQMYVEDFGGELLSDAYLRRDEESKADLAEMLKVQAVWSMLRRYLEPAPGTELWFLLNEVQNEMTGLVWPNDAISHERSVSPSEASGKYAPMGSFNFYDVNSESEEEYTASVISALLLGVLGDGGDIEATLKHAIDEFNESKSDMIVGSGSENNTGIQRKWLNAGEEYREKQMDEVQENFDVDEWEQWAFDDNEEAQ